MKMLTDKQIKVLLKKSESKSKRVRNKATSRLNKDLKKYGWYRLEICKKMFKELKGEVK